MINIILFTLFHLSLLAFIIYIARVKFGDFDRNFNSLVRVFSLLIVVYCVLLYLRIATPIALLFGPIHLSLYRISVGKNPRKHLFIQLLPFFLMLGLYCALYYSTQTGSNWSNTLFIYYPFYLVSAIVSSGGYGAYIWLVKWKAPSTNPARRLLILQLATIAFVIAIFLCISLLTLSGRLDQMKVGFNAIYIIIGLLLLCAGFMISYLTMDEKARGNRGIDNLVKTVKAENAKYYTYNIDRRTFSAYAQVLEKVINDKKLHFNSSLSLDDLSAETDIPKHHLSQLFNTYFGKSFYQYIAERRIQEAIFRIQNDENMTLESLAYECGFNSKTSFNRYFKDVTGMTPSDYRNRKVVTT